MALLIRRSFPVCISCRRAFTTSSRLRLQEQTAAPEIPPYPYGPAQWYKQADKGLYAGQRIRFGNNVGEKSGTKTRRSWQVNVFRKRLFSKALNHFVQVKVSQKALRTIDKVGGLDEYLLGETSGRIKELGLRGWELRWAIMQTPTVRRRFRQQREALGTPAVQKEVKKLEAGRKDAGEVKNVVEDGDLVVLEPNETAKASEPGYPRLRVSRTESMILTPSGWVGSLPQNRTPPAPTKSSVVQEHLKNQLKDAWALLNDHNAAIQAEGQKAMSRKQRLNILNQARQTLKEELENSKVVQQDFEQKAKKAAIEAYRRTKRRSARQVKVAARRKVKRMTLRARREANEAVVRNLMSES